MRTPSKALSLLSTCTIAQVRIELPSSALRSHKSQFFSLQTGIYVGRSNIKTVAEKRLPEVTKFIASLLHSAPEMLSSDLVITFFHPLLRDQQENADINAKKMKESQTGALPAPSTSQANICGEIKFSIHYNRGTFTVMVS